MQRRAAAVAGRSDDLDRPQAVRRSLHEQRAAPSRETSSRLLNSWCGERWRRTPEIVRAAQLDVVDNVAESPLALISSNRSSARSAAAARGPSIVRVEDLWMPKT